MASQDLYSLRIGPSGQEAFLNVLRSDFFGYLRMEEAVFDIRGLKSGHFAQSTRPRCPSTPRNRSTEDWVNTGRQFHLKTRFANCLGAIAGQHIPIVTPTNSGSEFRNPKGIDSIILLAAADSNFEFIFAECGSEGNTSVPSTFLGTELYDDLLEKKLNIHVPDSVERYPHALPYCFVSSTGYPSHPNVIQPYPQQGITPAQRHYNKLHCKAMRFSQFGVLQNPIAGLEMEDIQMMMLVICVLHNVLMRKSIKYKKSRPGKVAVVGDGHDKDVWVGKGGKETREMHSRYANSCT